MKPLLPILLILQCLLIAVLCFGDIGFDHPGRFGLDFGHFLWIVGGYLVLLLAGGVYAGVHGNWRWLAIQIALPLVVYGLAHVFVTYKPRYDAADYQHLVGMIKAEVHELLGARSRTTTGGVGSVRVGGVETEYEFEPYHGMTVYYRPNGPAIAVEGPGEMKFLNQ